MIFYCVYVNIMHRSFYVCGEALEALTLGYGVVLGVTITILGSFTTAHARRQRFQHILLLLTYYSV